jgi:hypothetical protein
MAKSRQELIAAGKIWQVYPDGQPENILHEGNKTSCNTYIRDHGLQRAIKTGKTRLAQILWEGQP